MLRQLNFITLAAMSLCIFARYSAADPDDVAEYVGAYEIATGRIAIVTFATKDNHLWVMDFDELNFSLAEPLDEPDAFSASTQGVAGLRFTRKNGAAVNGLQWTIDGVNTIATRLDTIRIEEVTWSNRDAELTATVMIPKSATPVAGAVIVQGSGTSSRDNLWSQSIAQRLAREGIAVLLPDKRGSGKSTGVWERSSFEDLALDALTAKMVLASTDGVDPTRIGVVGLSQGGWVAPLAAYLDPDVAFVVAVSGSVTTPGEQVMHEISQDIRNMGVQDPVIEKVRELIRLKNAAHHSIDAWPAYIDYRERLVATGFDQLNEGSFFPISPGGPQWTFWQLIHDFDPMPLWRSIDAPSLVVYGREDEHDNVPVERCEELLSELRKRYPGRDVTYRVFEGTGHGLMDQDREWGALREDFVDDLLQWLSNRELR